MSFETLENGFEYFSIMQNRTDRTGIVGISNNTKDKQYFTKHSYNF